MAAASDLQTVLSVLQAFADKNSSMKMLSIALPIALEGRAEERHPYQAEVIGMIRDSLKACYQEVAEEKEATNRNLETVKEELQVIVSHDNYAAAAETAANGEYCATEEMLAAAQKTVNQYELIWKDAKKLESEVLLARDTLQNSRDAAAAVNDGALCMLVGSNWEAGEASEDSIAAVEQHLTNIQCDSVLMAALPAAFRTKPCERGPFDKVVEQGVVDAIRTHLADVERKLAGGAKEAEDISAAALGAWAILEVSKDDVTKAKDEVAAANVVLCESKAKRVEAKKNIRAQEDRTSVALSRLTLQDEDLRRLSEAVQALDRLATQSYCDDNEPVAMETTG
eukprot:TRINITY_DN55705_c0_g1_i1.p1 TRINITY_DN55705_c0_g1~~TRINITY_DN55705_c0_g1_i1.p1  ORF type:complete len:360 (-),score=86.90 TRINITY_DN55705_c0_g1_i1:325-1344(-)